MIQIFFDGAEEDKQLRDLHGLAAGQGRLRNCTFVPRQVYKGQQDQTNIQCAVKVLDKKISKWWAR